MSDIDNESRESTLTILKKLGRVLAPYKTRVVALALLISFSAALEAVGPQFVRYAFDTVIPQGEMQLFLWFGLAFAGFYLFRAVVEYGGMFWSFALTQQVVSDVRMQAYEHLLKLPVSRFADEQSGSLSSRVVNDPNALEGMIQAAASRLSGQLVAILVVAVILVSMSWTLALVNLVVLPLLAAITYYYQDPLRQASRDIRETVARMTAASTEAISNIRVVKAFVSEDQERERFGEQNQTYVDLNLDRRKDVGAMEGLINITANYGIGALLLVGGWMTANGSLTIGELTAFIMYQRQLQGPIKSVMFFNDKLQAGMAALERLSDLTSTAPEDGGDKTDVPVGTVALEQVRFTYPEADEPALKGLSLQIEPGDTAALVGSSGAGKSTAASLIGRFWDPQEGRVTIDGQDLRSFDLNALRQRIALVPQAPTLFSGTVAENVRYADPTASAEAVRRAGKMANAHDFIQRLPKGYETQIGERGVRLSGGQKQRVAIARAILKDAQILLLDEATSDLDSESEAVIQDALDGLFARGQRLTSIVIAHRLSTIEDADTIFVLEEGRLVEAGSHDELLTLDGRYAELRALQRRDADSVPLGSSESIA
ncbi:ABC transporter ATP-binding protein [Salinibacter sp. 10B]|uniref:ABC transporter ATP-binding protein n=1 Tax=Salinibacter sp. 10B TaxID=1923971 RepID=UPI000CF3A089|nr:ABC transporter ATP-binding protein [Salinibacter sp. 10B]PQJ35471.1 ABC transporter ATP-binding protein [Salinibacter sp. 10B]